MLISVECIAILTGIVTMKCLLAVIKGVVLIAVITYMIEDLCLGGIKAGLIIMDKA